MSLRILGGALKNRLLLAPKGTQTRPTLGIVRKAVFDILQTKIEGAYFLDLFAGSGAMGLEALSRGAAHATFVDSHRLSVQCLKENITCLGMTTQSTILGYDAGLALKKLAKGGLCFDVVYIDPPYPDSARYRLLLELLRYFETFPNLLNAGASLFLEESTPPTPIPSISTLHPLGHRTFSQTVLHHFLKN